MSYTFLILSLWFIFIAYWIIAALGKKKRTVQQDPWWRFGGIALVAVVYLLYRLNWLPVPSTPTAPFFHSTLIHELGVALCAAGIAFAMWARHILGGNWSINPSIQEGHELVTTGPYHWVRHPIYTGILLAYLGALLAIGALWWVEVYVAVVVGLYIKLRREERLMMQQFPQAYPAYKQRTKALIPFVF